ncbi:Spo0B domain-containing protein [Cohnella cellulosilytica]|uniref:Spo0B domain-containing protein n=1 Tax=Cohnella cellulosilytica TaxID=986710 RepID=A0ABW2FAS3_9BACL
MSLKGPAALASLAMPVAAVLIWPRSWWALIVFVLWTLGVFAGLAARQRKQYRENCDKLLAHAQVSTIRTLSHHRHDWMNELQILYGYLRLNKLDKAVDVVDRIRTKMEQDSRVSQLGYPELSSYLLSFRTICDTMRLEVEVEDGLSLDKLPLEAESLSRAIIGLVNVIRFRASVPLAGENVLRMELTQEEGGVLKIVMKYCGELAAADSITEELEKCLQGTGRLAQGLEPAENSAQARKMVIHFPPSA